jgi:general secretion pathway protein I
MAILGLGLTSILSAQAGLFASSLRSERVTLASNLARCKLSEVEVDLLRLGYQLTEQKGEGACCANEDESTYSCTWKVEPVVLPEMNMNLVGKDAGAGNADAGALTPFNPTDTTGISSANPLGPLGAMMPGMGNGSSPFGMLGSGSGVSGSMGGLAAMALSIVYPTLKPMLEASIRRVTVSVKWNEGSSRRSFDIAEYVTNPMQGLPPVGSSSAGADPLGGLLGIMGIGNAAGSAAPVGGR